MNDKKLMNKAADNIRILAASMVEKSKLRTPPEVPWEVQNFINVLFSEFLVYDPENPSWEGRDRFLPRSRTYVSDAIQRIMPAREIHIGRTSHVPSMGFTNSWTS